MDQAGALRRLTRGLSAVPNPASNPNTSLRGLAVASGKGGVGKTNAVANIAYTMARKGKRVLIFDADMGLGNIHILLGVAPRFTLQDVISGERRMDEVIIRGPGGIDVLPAGSGNMAYNNLTGEEMLALKTELESIESEYDTIIVRYRRGHIAQRNVLLLCGKGCRRHHITRADLIRRRIRLDESPVAGLWQTGFSPHREQRQGRTPKGWRSIIGSPRSPTGSGSI